MKSIFELHTSWEFNTFSCVYRHHHHSQFYVCFFFSLSIWLGRNFLRWYFIAGNPACLLTLMFSNKLALFHWFSHIEAAKIPNLLIRDINITSPPLKQCLCEDMKTVNIHLFLKRNKQLAVTLKFLLLRFLTLWEIVFQDLFFLVCFFNEAIWLQIKCKYNSVVL